MMKFKVGDRVRIPSLNIKGVIGYIDYPSLYTHHLFPIQVTLDKAYDETDHRLYRTNLKDIKRLKKKKKREGKPKIREEIEQFYEWIRSAT